MKDEGGQGAEYWKEKYRLYIRESEDRERECQHREELLGKAIARLAVVGQGINASLDAQLSACRMAVKDGVDAVALQAALSRLTDKVVHRDPPAVRPGQELGELLRRMPLPEDLQDEIDVLLERVDVVVDATELDPLYDQLLGILQERLTPSQGQDTAHRDTRLCALLISEVLYELLEHLALPADLNERLAHLRGRLEEGLESGAWTGMLIEVSDMAADIRAKLNAERSDTERFLLDITGRLQELDEHFRGAASVSAESLEQGAELEAVFRAQVKGIENHVGVADDLGKLKRHITDGLEAIQRHLDGYREAEQRRHRQAHRELQMMTQRMKQMEQESHLLRERIRKERMLALVDPLTGIANRLAYEERIAQEFARWRRYRQPLSLVIWDVDHFKKINDQYGHQAGDNVLKNIAKLMGKTTRETDYVARYGGEEFVLIVAGGDVKAAAAVAGKLRKAVEAAGFLFHGEPVKVTISCGIAEFSGDDTPKTVFERADKALYKAKEQGRNRCVTATS